MFEIIVYLIPALIVGAALWESDQYELKITNFERRQWILRQAATRVKHLRIIKLNKTKGN